MAKIPGKRKRAFYERKWVIEFLSSVPPIIAGGYAALMASKNPQTEGYAGYLLFGILWLAVASVLKVVHARSQDAEVAQKDSHDGLAAAVRVLHAVVAKNTCIGDECNGVLRITIHRVVPPLDRPEGLEQLIPYIGGDGGDAYRRFPVQSGIAGRVAREKTPYVYSRQTEDHEAFISVLIREWGFTEHHARTLKPDRRSWMAVPIFSTNNVVVAIVYLDSNRAELFDDGVKALVLSSCAGIASYVSERYRS